MGITTPGSAHENDVCQSNMELVKFSLTREIAISLLGQLSYANMYDKREDILYKMMRGSQFFTDEEKEILVQCCKNKINQDYIEKLRRKGIDVDKHPYIIKKFNRQLGTRYIPNIKAIINNQKNAVKGRKSLDDTIDDNIKSFLDQEIPITIDPSLGDSVQWKKNVKKIGNFLEFHTRQNLTFYDLFNSKYYRPGEESFFQSFQSLYQGKPKPTGVGKTFVETLQRLMATEYNITQPFDFELYRKSNDND